MDISKLKKEIPYEWKVQTGKPGAKGGWCVAYIDARDAMDLLDEVCGAENWKDEYLMVGDRLTCKLSIKVDNEWVAKQDTGTESQSEAEKGQFSDAFKRAGVKWGIGRFLYSLEMKWVDFDSYGKPVDTNGKRIYNLTEYFNKLSSTSSTTANVIKDTTEIKPKTIPAKATKTCPVCGKEHTGRYPKCLDCWKKDQPKK